MWQEREVVSVERAILGVKWELAFERLTMTPEGRLTSSHWPWSTNGTKGANAESFAQIDCNAEDL